MNCNVVTEDVLELSRVLDIEDNSGVENSDFESFYLTNILEKVYTCGYSEN